MRRRSRLTREQEALRLQGLRLLARVIVRAHLARVRAASLGVAEEDSGCDGVLLSAPGAESPDMEVGHGG